MKKKLLFTLAASVCALTCAFSLAACGDDNKDMIEFELSSDGSYYSVSKINHNKSTEKRELTIPAEHEGKPVKRIQEDAVVNKYYSHFSRVTIPDSVTYIADEAFKGCDIDALVFGSYENAELNTDNDKIQPYSIYIGAQAFMNNNLKALTVPENAYLSNQSFSDNPIATVKFNGGISVDKDGNYTLNAFHGSTALQSIDLPENTVKYNVGLSSLTLTQSSGTSSIDIASYKMPLEYVVVPENVTLTGDWARGQIDNKDIYPPKIYYKGAAGLPKIAGGVTGTTKVYQTGKPEMTFGQFVYNYSETKSSGNTWHYVNGVPTKW